MKKVNVKPQTLLYPLPSVMVSCCNNKGENNIITISWIGIISSEPPMLSISVRPERHSYSMIKETMDFVVNIPTVKLAKENDYCGVKSGREVNKFEVLNLTPIKGEKVDAPIIKECPINLECKVKEIINLGSHDIFISEIVNIQLDEEIVNNNTANFTPEDYFVYLKGEYVGLNNIIGKAGYSLK